MRESLASLLTLLGGPGPRATGRAVGGAGAGRAWCWARSVRLTTVSQMGPGCPDYQHIFDISCSKSLEVSSEAPKTGVDVIGTRVSPNHTTPSLKLTEGAAQPDQAPR